MTIRMKQSVRNGLNLFGRNQVVTVPDAQGRELIAAQFATIVQTIPERREKALRKQPLETR